MELKPWAASVDKTENPEKNFAKGIIFAAIVISIGYSLAIFLWGVSTNWQQVLSNNTTNLGNITYVLMKSLGVTLGNAMDLAPETSATLGGSGLRGLPVCRCSSPILARSSR